LPIILVSHCLRKSKWICEYALKTCNT
jgi:hypothetical protein